MKISIYAGAPIEALLDGYEDNRSGRLNTVAERYAGILAAHTPAFTEFEWCAICDALNGPYMGLGDPSSVRFAWASISDAATEGLGEKWRVDAHELARRVRALSFAESVALIEVVQRFWHMPNGNAGEILRQAGARITEGNAR
jgi:hypothetical protein